jgi:hypothetical protein
VIPEVLISVFNVSELELLICGLPNLNIDDWQINSDYVGEFGSKKKAHKVRRERERREREREREPSSFISSPLPLLLSLLLSLFFYLFSSPSSLISSPLPLLLSLLLSLSLFSYLFSSPSFLISSPLPLLLSLLLSLSLFSYLFSSPHKVVKWFWEVLRDDFTEEEKAKLLQVRAVLWIHLQRIHHTNAKLLQFATGTSGVPIQGFSALQGPHGIQRFTLNGIKKSISFYPRAHTVSIRACILCTYLRWYIALGMSNLASLSWLVLRSLSRLSYTSLF